MSHTPVPTPPRATLTGVLAAALAEHAAHTFGLMGNGNAHLIDALGKLRVPFTAVRHEAATVASADAFWRVSGDLAIATTTYGAGFTNTLTALAEAAQARTPMLVVVGDAPETGQRPWDVDQERLASAVGVRQWTLTTSGVQDTVAEAAAYAVHARTPVIIAIPYDLVSVPVVELEPVTDLPTVDHAAPAVPTIESLREAAQLILTAKRPVILAGRGAHLARAGQALDTLHDLLGGATASTALCRGIFTDTRTHLGVTGGFGHEAAMQLIETCDVAIVVGAGLNQFTMRFGDLFGEGTRIIRIDTEPTPPPKSNREVTQLMLQGDARETVLALTDQLHDPEALITRHSQAFTDEVISLDTTPVNPAKADGICEDDRLDPRSVASRIAELLPKNVYVTQDGGHFLAWSNMFFDISSPERMTMVGTAYQTIGLGFGTVPGVAAAVPDETIVLSTGDGGGLMALADLESAIRTAKSLVIVVWNDAAYGAEVHLYGVMGLDQEPMHIPDANFAGIAEALGAHSVRVNTLEDLDALKRWREAGAQGTILLDCRISHTVVAPYQREVQRANGVSVSD